MMNNPSSLEQDRPQDARRADYRHAAAQDRLMVQLLAEHIQRGIKEHARAVGSNGRALDVGCGAQPMRGEIEARGLVYTGMDVVQNPVKTVDFVAAIDGELQEELAAAGPFAFMLCTEVLEHVADWREAFANLARLLAPGGRMLVTVPFVWPLHEVPYDFWRPTVFALRTFGERNGLRVIEETKAGDWYAVYGTVVGHASFQGIPIPGLRWLSRKVFGAMRRLVLAILARRWIRRVMPMRSNLYLSNVVVFEKS